MKIAVTASQGSPESPVDSRFGRAPFFILFSPETGRFEAVENRQNLQAAQGAGIQSAAVVVNAGCTILITGHCGPKAHAALRRAGVTVYAASDMSVSEAVAAQQAGKLKRLDSADVEGHW